VYLNLLILISFRYDWRWRYRSLGHKHEGILTLAKPWCSIFRKSDVFMVCEFCFLYFLNYKEFLDCLTTLNS
jgi:hypothetical protein